MTTNEDNNTDTNAPQGANDTPVSDAPVAGTPAVDPTLSFADYGFSQEILKAITERNFVIPTEVQAKSFDPVLDGNDVVVQAKTGSGKTAAFGLPLIEILKLGEPGLRALILTPTRELAKQVSEDLESFAKYTQLNFAVVYGGVGMEPQVRAIESADAVVGTPGRILDHMNQGTLDLSSIQFLVLDEADRMLDMGFIDDVKRILSAIPKDHITMMFSATMPDEVRSIADRMMVDPIQIKCESFVDDSLLAQFYIDSTNRTKLPILKEILSRENPGLAIVFCATRGLTDAVAEYLQANRISAEPIHGGLTQARREKIIDGFHEGKIHVLVATDVAARGLDIDGVTHVFNYNVPKTPQEYTHRMGRTARAGREGKVITLLADSEHQEFGPIDAYFREKILKYDLGDFRPVAVSLAKRSSDDGPRHGRAGNFGGPRRDGDRPRSGGFSGPRRDGGRPQSGGFGGPRGPRRDGPRPSGGSGGSRN